jgi:hypothetical protein
MINKYHIIDYIDPIDLDEWWKDGNALVAEYFQLLRTTLKYVVDKLNQKATHSNMISFCVKVLDSYKRQGGLKTNPS